MSFIKMEEMNYLDLFGQTQETYEEAAARAAAESKSFETIKSFRMDSDGTYNVRILPQAPVIINGEIQPLERKSYEFPLQRLFITVQNPKASDPKKLKRTLVISNAKQAGFTTDLIDTYVNVANETCDDDILEKINSNAYSGGLKWDRTRVMYCIDMNNRKDGIQMLTLSYSQYRDMDDAKLSIWQKLLKKNKNQGCPITSIKNAYPVEIERKKNGTKTEYRFTIDTFEEDTLSEKELKILFEMQRIPDAIYRYTRWHLEATIEFLKQYDEKLGIHVMDSESVQETIEKIKLEIPSDDTSHFSFDKKDEKAGNGDEQPEVTIDTLWDMYDKNKDDKTEGGQELRDLIRQFIDDNNLEIRVSRSKTNKILLEDIEDCLDAANNKGGGYEEEEDDNDQKPADEEAPIEEPSDDEEDAEDGEPEEKEAPIEEEVSSRRRNREERNDDTNEPAVRSRRERPTRIKR